jgi:DNA-directed RNA polymerase subunit M/transcription elongation factor TFIIS
MLDLNDDHRVTLSASTIEAMERLCTAPPTHAVSTSSNCTVMPRGLAIQIPCPQCSSRNTYVVSTYHTVDYAMVRRRHCRSCNHRWYTQQQPEQPLDSYRIKWIDRQQHIVELTDAE